MFEFFMKIWYFIALLPFFIFQEGSEMFTKFLKKRDIYHHWDIWHSALVFFIVVLIILWINGFRP